MAWSRFSSEQSLKGRVAHYNFLPQTRSVIAAWALLLLMFLLAGGAALRESVTIDEVAHIGAGLSYVQKLDLRFNDEHPPLAKILTGMSLAIRGTRADYSSPQWTIGKSFFPAYLGEWVFGEWVLSRWNTPQSTLSWARFPMLLLTLLLGWVLFVFGRRLGGDWGGLLCLAAYTSMPTFLAFGPLVLTDVAIALFSVLTLWTLGELWRNPDRRTSRWFTLALAGALLSKFSSGVLCIAILVFILTTRWWPLAAQPSDKVEARAWRKLRWRALRRSGLHAAAIVYAVYFVFSWNQPVDIPGFAAHGSLVAFAGRLLMPPWLFLRGLAWVLLTAVRPSFLLGHAYPHGVWSYFPVLLVLKSPPGFLGLLLLTLTLSVWHRSQFRTPAVIPLDLATHWRAIWVSLVVFTGVCLIGTMDISIRHFSVPLVLLTLLIAPLPRLIQRTTGRVMPTTAVLAATLVSSCLVTAVRAYPHYLPYVSPFGMRRPLYWLMSDSNVDWNHALPEVNLFARDRGLTDVPMDIYGFSDTRAFVPNSRLWDCQAPADSDAGLRVFVSSNMILDSHNCAWIMQYPHQPLAGGAMYAIQLPSAIPPAGSPGGPPPLSARRLFLNAPVELRVMFREVTDHPERMQKAMDDMVAAWQKSSAGGEAEDGTLSVAALRDRFALPLQCTLYCRYQFVRPKRLGEQGAASEPFRIVGRAAHEHDLPGLIERTNTGRQRNAVHLRHIDVGKHQVETRAVGRVDHEAFQTVARPKYVVALLLQNHHHKLPEGFVVFDYQHRSHNRFSGSAEASEGVNPRKSRSPAWRRYWT